MEEELLQANQSLNDKEKEIIDYKKANKKAQKQLEEQEETIADLNDKNQDLDIKLQEVEAEAKEQILMQQLMLQEREEDFEKFKKGVDDHSLQSKFDASQLQEQFAEKEREYESQIQMLKDQIYMIKYERPSLRMTVGSNALRGDFRDTMNEEELAHLNDNMVGGFGNGPMGGGPDYEERSRHTYVMSQDGGGMYS